MRRRILLRLRGDNGQDAGAALLIALFVMVTVTTLSISVAGIVLNQTKPTQLLRKDVQTVHAAESGIEAALGQIRSAVTTNGDGDRAKLPCVNGGGATLTSANAGQPGLGFSVVISYFTLDPTGRSASWLSSNRLACAAGGGLSVTPIYALIVSDGTGPQIPHTTAGAGNRELTAVYNFELTNQNISGGPIKLFTTSRCIDAGSNPKAGNPVQMQTCNGSPQQAWAYTDKLMIQLTGMASNTLCLAADPSVDQVSGVKLKACNVNDFSQIWSYNDAGEYQGKNKADLNLSNWCFQSSDTGGALITLTTVCNSAHDNVHTWDPDPRVGAGMAGTATRQLVNYKEFGRCLDVTDWDVTKTFHIDYPCKQTPDPSKIGWNELWYGPDANGWVYIVNGSGVKYCLTAGNGTTPAISGTRVLTRQCAGSYGPAQQWISVGKVGSWADSYEYISRNGPNLCLSLATAPPENLPKYPWSIIVTETCNGGTQQKWNAPPEPLKTGIDTWETTS